jgi:restriction system protein
MSSSRLVCSRSLVDAYPGLVLQWRSLATAGVEMTRRRSTVLGALAQAQRQSQQTQAARQRAHLQAQRAAERQRREAERARARDDKERAHFHAEARQAEADQANQDLESRVGELGGLLAAALSVDGWVDFEALKRAPMTAPFEPGSLGKEEPPPSLVLPPEPNWVAKHLPSGKKYPERVEQVRRQYEDALAAHGQREKERIQSLEERRREHEARVEQSRQEAEKHNAEIDDYRQRFEARDVPAVVDYFTMVLQGSHYPDGFPQDAKVGYVPESRQLVVEYDLPDFTIIPEVASHRYVKSGDKITTSQRPATQRKALYNAVVAQIPLRTLEELFQADRAGDVETIVFNGYVDTVHPGTGQPHRPCLVTLRTTRDVFAGIDLKRVDPIQCLKTLNASVSKSAAELAPVRPVLDLSMVDPRFIQATDVISELDQRSNLMELTPSEFESLITNLFEKMGLETRLTQASRDGGVDCVAYDSRPILGGKVVIQAKRYKNTVGVSAVRDLFGTMQNEGASKGILVTTSGYGKASFEFAEGKPLELLSGSNLLYLLSEHAGMEAKIEAPEDWQDPEPDTEPQVN